MKRGLHEEFLKEIDFDEIPLLPLISKKETPEKTGLHQNYWKKD